MRDYKIIWIILLACTIIMFSFTFVYNLFLKEQYESLMKKFEKMATMVSMLIKRDEELREKLAFISEEKKISKVVKERRPKIDTEIVGNRGYLIKGGKPTN